MPHKLFLRHLPWQVVIPFCLFLLHSLAFGSWLVDDAGVSFAYARNLAHGHGLVAQVGAEPVEGFSNPLWTFLLAPVFAGDPADPRLPVKLASLGLILCTFAIVRRITAALFGGRTFWATATCIAVLMSLAVNTSFVAWTTSGLENPLYALLAALYCLYCVRYATAMASSPRIAMMVGLSAAGLALTRPDGIVFVIAFLLIAGIRWLRKPAKWRGELRSAGLFLLIGLTPVLIYAAFRYVYFGDWLPNTYYAKAGTAPGDLAGLLLLGKPYRDKTRDLLSGVFGGSTYVFVGVLAAGAVLVVLRSPSRRALLAIGAAAVCSWAIYCLLPKDWMAEYRFATPFFLLFYLLLFGVMAQALQASRLAGPAARRAVFVVCIAAAVAYSAAIHVSRTRQFAAAPTARFMGVAQEVALPFNTYADALGMVDASLLCPDVGATLYYSRLKVYDLGGLCDRRISRLIDRDPRAICDYVFDQVRPTFIDLHDGWVLRTELCLDPRFRQAYVPIWETTCQYARQEEQLDGLLEGHYVRRDALPSLARLEQLRQRCGNGTGPLDVNDLVGAVAFPRDNRPPAAAALWVPVP